MEACESLGAQCLDLLPLFVAHDAGRLHYRLDGHMNAAGHDLAAESIYRELIEAGLVPSSHAAPEPVERHDHAVLAWPAWVAPRHSAPRLRGSSLRE
jgi:hypothetical protein